MPEEITLPRELLSEFNHYLCIHTGLNFSENRLRELERGLRAASGELGFDDPVECMHRLMASPLTRKQIEVLSIHLTVGETYFFREPESFETLEFEVLPQLAAKAGGRPGMLRIWSAACSSGEEPYSIAMLLDRKKQLFEDWEITILATDINLNALEKAEQGVYTPWSLRNLPKMIETTYFNNLGQNRFEVKPHIKKMVQFDYLNLAEDVYPSLLNNTNAMDIVFCRNVLMYFLPAVADNVIPRLYRSLVPDGWLMVSPTDAFHVLDNVCFKRFAPGLSLFVKCEKGEEVKAEPVKTSWTPPPKLPQPPEPPRSAPVENPLEEAREKYKNGDYTGAASLISGTLLPGANAGEAHALAARSFANLGQLDEAETWCRKAIDTDKLDPEFHYLLAVIHQEQGRPEDAVQSLKKCLYVDRDFIAGHFTMGNIALHQHEWATARKHLQTALSLLAGMEDGQIVSREEGLTAGRLRTIANALLEKESLHGH